MSIGLVRAMGVSIAIALVASCGEPPPRALFTVNYYKTHQSDRLAKLKECQGNPATEKTPDCVNAARAEGSPN
ncbi:MAG: EexN family lipoprotein [Gammaproteobacteria bacterium]